MEIAHHQDRLRRHLKALGRQQDTRRMRFRLHRIVPGNDHVEIVDGQA
jgi:hypothetical protein